jgi:hypothetical protein
MKVPYVDFIQNVSQAPSMCLSERILRINWISKILFVKGFYEFLAILEGKIRNGSFF